MRKITVLVVAALISTFAFSQTASPLKLAHINTQELLQAMPERDSAQVKMEKETKKLQDEMETMKVELNKKYQDFLAKEKTYSDLIKQTKQAEMQDMQQRIQEFQTTAEQELQKLRSEIFKPVLDKANKAISDVSKENGFTYVFDISAGAVIYHADNSTDMLPLVKAKLKLK